MKKFNVNLNSLQNEEECFSDSFLDKEILSITEYS